MRPAIPPRDRGALRVLGSVPPPTDGAAPEQTPRRSSRPPVGIQATPEALPAAVPSTDCRAAAKRAGKDRAQRLPAVDADGAQFERLGASLTHSLTQRVVHPDGGLAATRSES